MALKLVLDKLEDVDEAHRPFYVEKEGKFHLDVDGLEDNSGALRSAQSALKKANEDAVKRRKQLETWEKLGKSPEEIVQLLTEQEEERKKHEETEAAKRGEWESLRAQMNEKHAVDLKKLQDVISNKDKEIISLQSTLENHIVEHNAVSAIAAEKGIPQLLLPAVKRHIKVNNENGSLGIQVVDDKGEPRVNGKGEPLTLQELVSEMRGSEIFGRAFEGSGASGSGARPGNGAAPPGGITRRGEFKSEKERAAWVDKFGMSAYNSLPM